MQAVILAGGLGTRLWPLTETIPKPLLPVAGVPYLEHQLRLLAQQGLRDILLLTGYLGEQIETYFGNGDRMGLRLSYSREQSPRGTGGALRDARHQLDDTFLVIYGDSYLPIQYRDVCDRLISSLADGVVVVYDNSLEDTSVRNNIALTSNGYVAHYQKDSSEHLSHVEAGVLAFRYSVVTRISTQGAVSLENEMFPQLIKEERLAAFVTKQRFYDIGTPDRLAVLETLLTSAVKR
jgi:NDP-sugar pyrophosphorylase family protein